MTLERTCNSKLSKRIGRKAESLKHKQEVLIIVCAMIVRLPEVGFWDIERSSMDWKKEGSSHWT